MKNTITYTGVIFILVSQLLLSFGYDFLMNQKPIDFAHWAMLLGSVFCFGLWFSLPSNATKYIGLSMMSLGIAFMSGMCVIDFLLWAAHDNMDLKKQIFELITGTPSLQIPFLYAGPGLFYFGIGIATYGLFSTYKWQVFLINLGVLMIGLGHVVLGNRIIPVIGAALLLLGLISIIRHEEKRSS